MQKSFRTLIDEEYLGEKAHRVRWQKSIDFLAGSSQQGSAIMKGLDLGDRTPMTAMLERFFGTPFDNTAVDLDTERLEGYEGFYGVVTALEVLEHLYNPLHLLLQVRPLLSGGGGRLFVSMPIHKPSLLQSPGHFHEMSRASAESLFVRAGFRIVRRREFRIRHPLFYLTGLKPLLRAWYEKVQIYELAVQ